MKIGENRDAFSATERPRDARRPQAALDGKRLKRSSHEKMFVLIRLGQVGMPTERMFDFWSSNLRRTRENSSVNIYNPSDQKDCIWAIRIKIWIAMRNVCLHQVQAGRCQICFFIVSFTLSFFSLRVQPRQLFNFSTITSGITSKDATRQYKGRVPGKVIWVFFKLVCHWAAPRGRAFPSFCR